MENRSKSEFKGPTMIINWQADEAIATIVSSVAIVASAIFVVVQLRQAARERYFTITANLVEIWQSSQFQDDQLFLLHKMNAVSWDEFVVDGRTRQARAPSRSRVSTTAAAT
jgi:hypothetical protein